MGWTVVSNATAGSYDVTVFRQNITSEGYWKYDSKGNLIDAPEPISCSGSGSQKFRYKGNFTITLKVTVDGSCVVTAGDAYHIVSVTREERMESYYDTVLIKEDYNSEDDVGDTDLQTTYVNWTAYAVNNYGYGILDVGLSIEWKASSAFYIWEDDEEEEDDEEDEEETVVSRPVVTPTKTVEKTVTTSADGTTIDTVTVTTERTVVLGGIYYNEVPITSVWKTDNITNVTNCNGDTATETTTVTTVTERTETGSDSATTESGNVTTTTTTSTTKTLTEVEADYIL